MDAKTLLIGLLVFNVTLGVIMFVKLCVDDRSENPPWESNLFKGGPYVIAIVTAIVAFVIVVTHQAVKAPVPEGGPVLYAVIMMALVATGCCILVFHWTRKAVPNS